MNKTEIRFFTIADFIEEEEWLRQQHQSGWRLEKTIIPCFFIFEQCEPEDVIYRLDYKNGSETSEYKQMFMDFGWEYFNQCMGWLYFRKPASEITSEEEGEIFSDNESRIEMVRKIQKTRVLPITIIFLCCVIPQLSRSFESGFSFFTMFWIIMLCIYIYLILHCGMKLKRMRDQLENR